MAASVRLLRPEAKRLKKTLLLLVVLGAGAAGAAWWFRSKSAAPRVPFSKTTRQTISNVLSTNGKVEPFDYVQVRVESAGLVKRVLVHEGDSISKGQVLAELSEPGLQQELDAAKAREAQARADLLTFESGGRSGEMAEIDGN